MKKFTFNGMTFTVPDEVENYVHELVRSYSLQREAKHLFREKYYGYKNMDTLVQNLEKDMGLLLMDAIQVYVQDWIDQGFYDMNTETFIQDYYMPECRHSLKIESAYEKVMDDYNEIVLSKEQKEEYRRLRMASRGRWVGGGFGVGGAIKGAATAGAFNVASGIGHGAVNLIGNLGTSIAVAGKKRRLYENPETERALEQALGLDVFHIVFAQTKLSTEHFSLKYKYRTTTDSEKARTILSNIRDRKLKKDEFSRLAHQLFELDPYNVELYEWLLMTCGDEKKELDAIADYFLCGDQFGSIKNDLLEEIVDEAPKEGLEDYKNLLGELEETALHYGISDDNQTLSQVRDKYQELDLAARTYEEVVYDSVEAAEKAKEEKAELDALFAGIDKTKEEALLAGKEKLEAYQPTAYSKEGYLKEINSTLEKVINERETNELNNILKRVDILDKSGLIQIRDELEKIEFKTISKETHLDQIQKYIDNYEINVRTVEGRLYDTVEEADVARKEVSDYESILKRVIKDDMESLINAENSLKNYAYVKIYPGKYIRQVEDMLDRCKRVKREKEILKRMEEIEEIQKEALEKRDFPRAMRETKECDLPNQKKEELMDKLNKRAQELLSKEIGEAVEYGTDEDDSKNIIFGMIFFLIIGAFLTRYFAIAFKVAVVLDILGFFGYLDERKKRSAKKASYRLISNLRDLGYKL